MLFSWLFSSRESASIVEGRLNIIRFTNMLYDEILEVHHPGGAGISGETVINDQQTSVFVLENSPVESSHICIIQIDGGCIVIPVDATQIQSFI